jgi:hypothetical protein
LDRGFKGEFIAVGKPFLTAPLCPLALGLFVIYIVLSILEFMRVSRPLLKRKNPAMGKTGFHMVMKGG